MHMTLHNVAESFHLCFRHLFCSSNHQNYEILGKDYEMSAVREHKLASEKKISPVAGVVYLLITFLVHNKPSNFSFSGACLFAVAWACLARSLIPEMTIKGDRYYASGFRFGKG